MQPGKTSKTMMRTASGAATIVMVLLASLLAMGISLFGFELTRVFIAKQQLKSACEAAALGSACRMVSAPLTSDLTASNPLQVVPQEASAAHTAARATGFTFFKQNYLFDKLNDKAQLVPDAVAANVAPDEIKFSLAFVDKSGFPVADNDVTGRSSLVSAKVGYVPAFGKFLGIGCVPLIESAKAGLPKMDVAVALDTSGSMTLDTQLMYVRREWDGSKIVYTTVTSCNIGQLKDAGGGLGGWGTHPDRMKSGTDFNDNPVNFNPALRGAINHPNAPDPEGGCAGSPPGNYPGGAAAAATDFTDIIPAAVVGTAKFPDLATAVEAARGNLENDTVYKASKADTAVNAAFVGHSTRAEYVTAATSSQQPFHNAMVATNMMMSMLYNGTDVHFALVPFGRVAGSEPSSPPAWTPSFPAQWASDPGTPSVAQQERDFADSNDSIFFAQPLVPLDKHSDNFSNVLTTEGYLTVSSGTDTPHAIKNSRQQLKSGQSRDGVRKFLLLITDGLPVDALGNQDYISMSYDEADKCGDAGIPIYSFGFFHPPTDKIDDGRDVLKEITDRAGGTSEYFFADGGGAGGPNSMSSAELAQAYCAMLRHMVILLQD